MSEKQTRLSVKGVNKRFGGLQALSDVGLQIEEGTIYGLIGLHLCAVAFHLKSAMANAEALLALCWRAGGRSQ